MSTLPRSVSMGVVVIPLIACSGKYIPGPTGDSGSTGGTSAGGVGGTSAGGVGGTSAGGVGGTSAGGVGGTSTGGTGGTSAGGMGGTSTGGTGGVMEQCTSSGYSDVICGACMEAICASVCTNCYESNDCLSWLQCDATCSDSACVEACSQQYPSGEAPARDWMIDCLGTFCSSDCGSANDCGLNTGGAEPECDTCLAYFCCGQGKSCATEQGCLDVLQCIDTCPIGDSACEAACADADPAGSQLLDEFLACLNQSCATECPLG